MNKHRIFLYFLLSVTTIAIGCKKFLDDKPRKNLAVPVTLQDYQALMDNYLTINSTDPPCSEIVSGDIYLTDADLTSRIESERRQYLWQKGNLYELPAAEWINTFKPIYTANAVIEGIAKNGENNADWNNLLGQAYYIRAKCYLQAAYIWTLAYDESTAATDLGLPLRLHTDFNQTSTRSNLAETYAQIEKDLKRAIQLLNNAPLHVMRASKPAAYALLSRTYLSMRNYQSAGIYADSCLRIKKDLQDFNALDSTLAYPYKQYNTEVITFSNMSSPTILSVSRAKINPELYAIYQVNDLRKTMYFKDNGNKTFSYRGSYNGNSALFNGIATNEVYLMRAECYARAGKITEALTDLNLLLVNRYRKGKFSPVNIADQSQLITYILTERRKELPQRGIRWMDIKRQNKEGRNIVLSRTYNGTVYQLQPNDPRYALTLPEDVIQLTGMEQNK